MNCFLKKTDFSLKRCDAPNILLQTRKIAHAHSQHFFLSNLINYIYSVKNFGVHIFSHSLLCRRARAREISAWMRVFLGSAILIANECDCCVRTYFIIADTREANHFDDWAKKMHTNWSCFSLFDFPLLGFSFSFIFFFFQIFLFFVSLFYFSFSSSSLIFRKCTQISSFFHFSTSGKYYKLVLFSEFIPNQGHNAKQTNARKIYIMHILLSYQRIYCAHLGLHPKDFIISLGTFVCAFFAPLPLQSWNIKNIKPKPFSIYTIDRCVFQCFCYCSPARRWNVLAHLDRI